MPRIDAREPGPAKWPYQLPDSLSSQEVEEVRRRVDALADAAQYGWGHTIDFGPFTKEGVLKENYLAVAGYYDALEWWPRSMEGLRVADIGSFTGGLSLLVAHRGAAEVVAVDEIPEHIAQCAYLCELFGADQVRSVQASLYSLPEEIERGSFDFVLLAGVLYHLSDMLVGLLISRDLLKIGGTLLIEGTAVADDEHSYANFGRFAMGTWWQPSTLCVRDMCEFMGLSSVETTMWRPDHCLARAVKSSDEPPRFRRGLNYPFEDLRDGSPRPNDLDSMAPR